ncbi:hypothetical protein M9H77_02948 [Catharanthus roseus]|uniref:Uncharacterized protein n=1 Tax=Catharanthus roseus TaxID=4058 RepID=A0ACC0CA14_CATRO|nr:hypothetical protein M9H77_02948 [Catharanthus roseus]
MAKCWRRVTLLPTLALPLPLPVGFYCKFLGRAHPTTSVFNRGFNGRFKKDKTMKGNENGQKLSENKADNINKVYLSPKIGQPTANSRSRFEDQISTFQASIGRLKRRAEETFGTTIVLDNKIRMPMIPWKPDWQQH